MRSARASVVKLDNARYRVTVELERDPATGKRRRKSKTVRGSRRDAEDMRIKLLAEGDSYGSDTTLRQYVDAVYLPKFKAKRKPRSYLTVTDRLRLYIMPVLGDYKLPDITPRKIRHWLTTIDGEAKKCAAWVTLRPILNQAVKAELISASPLAKVDAPQVHKYKPDVLDATQAIAYLDHFKGSPVEAAVLLAIGGGFRRGEIAALNWEDISPAGLVTIDDSITEHGGQTFEGSPKSDAGTRTAQLPQSIYKRLCALSRGSGAVLIENDTRMKPNRITKLYSKTRKTLPDTLPRIALKNLRHTSLTLAYDAGVDLLAVSRRAGHSTTSITSDYYVRPKGSRDREAAVLMDKVLTRDNSCLNSQRALVFEVVSEF
jgi:integrase